MDKLKEKSNLEYAMRLDEKHRQRYFMKLQDLNGFDPYLKCNQKMNWSKETNILPPVTYGDIVNYLVLGQSFYTFDQFKNFKSLEAHQQFLNGWVQDVEMYIPERSENFVLRSKVMHSQKLNEKVLLPWVIASPDGTIKSAHCNCMAGLAETCTHVAALLFKVEALVRVRERTTVTGEAAYWMIPGSINKVKPMEAYAIDFTTSDKKQKKLDTIIETGKLQQDKRALLPLKQSTPKPSPEELDLFFNGLKGTSAAILSVLPFHCQSFKDPVKPVILPQSLSSLRDESCDALCYTDLLKHSFIIYNKISIKDEQCKKIENITRDQHKSPQWFSQRAGRITASNLHSVCTFENTKPSLTTIKNVCYPGKQLAKVPAVQWGLSNEQTAKFAFENHAKCLNLHTNLSVEHCGFVINSHMPYLGASPDGILNCECCGRGCLEIKCPYKFKDMKITDAFLDPGFCLTKEGGVISLKKSHSYFYQVQAQMSVTQTEYCDFFVWTTKDFINVRVHADPLFMNICKKKS